MMSNAAKSFDILPPSLSVLHNYFNSSTKLFSVKFLDFQQNYSFHVYI